LYLQDEQVCGIAWNDPAICIIWHKGLEPQLSAKYQAGFGLAQTEVFA